MVPLVSPIFSHRQDSDNKFTPYFFLLLTLEPNCNKVGVVIQHCCDPDNCLPLNPLNGPCLAPRDTLQQMTSAARIAVCMVKFSPHEDPKNK